MIIYTLSSSESPDNIRYIGKSKNLKDRLRRHIGKYYLNSEVNYKNNWIKSELSKGNKILINGLETVNENDWREREQYWIEQFKQWGFKLVNTTEGGDGLVLTSEIVKKRNKTRMDNNKSHKLEIIKKFNIRVSDGLWMGDRICVKCCKIVTHKSVTMTKVINILIKSENRNCFSCTRFICNKDKGTKNFGEVGKIRSRKILQYSKNGEFIAEFNSIHEASRILKINRKSIINCANGVKWHNTAGGYIFKYK